MIQSLTKLHDTLLLQLISGELRVSEAEQLTCKINVPKCPVNSETACLTIHQNIFSVVKSLIIEIRPVVSGSGFGRENESQPWCFGTNVDREWKLPRKLWLLPSSLDGPRPFQEYSKFLNLYFCTELKLPLQGDSQ